MTGVSNNLNSLNESIRQYIQRLHDNGLQVTKIDPHQAGVTLNVKHEGATPIFSIPAPSDHRMISNSFGAESKIYLLTEGDISPSNKGSLA